MALAVLLATGCQPGGVAVLPGGFTRAVSTLGQPVHIESRTGLVITSQDTTPIRTASLSTPVGPAPPGLALLVPGQATSGSLAFPTFANATVVQRSSPGQAVPTVSVVSALASDPHALDVTLPAGPDAEAWVYLHDGQGGLVGSGKVSVIPTAGQQRSLTIVPNTEVARLLGSDGGVNVADGVVLRQVNLDLDTGIADNLPGVDHVEVSIAGPAYGNGVESGVIGTFQTPNLQNYTWKPQLSSGTYDAGKLQDSANPVPFVLTTKAYDAFGNLIGVAKQTLSIVGAAYVNVGVAPN